MESVVAISTPPGSGGIAVIRLSGDDALQIANSVWKGASLEKVPSHSAHLGEITDEKGEMLDQAVATVFHAGKSFTGEATVEFSIHGSRWLQQAVINRIIAAGASPAPAGEFTRRSFLNGRIDLTQAEGIADMIAADSACSAKLAASQMKGNFSMNLNRLRQQLIELAALLELELDFSEEDVEFADRKKLIHLCCSTLKNVDSLTESFRTGKALKEGVRTVITGIPNAGKSTLLNSLLGCDKAIVSNIPGTTRDIIEDTIEINGILFRFIDTAGLRDAGDEIEKIGIERAETEIKKADIVLWLFDPTADWETQKTEFEKLRKQMSSSSVLILLKNKSDLNKDGEGGQSGAIEKFFNADILTQSVSEYDILSISAREDEGIEELKSVLTEKIRKGYNPESDMIITNARHYEALRLASQSLSQTLQDLEQNLSADIISQSLRQSLHHIGLITGVLTTDTLLSTIFSRFCIGK